MFKVFDKELEMKAVRVIKVNCLFFICGSWGLERVMVCIGLDSD